MVSVGLELQGSVLSVSRCAAVACESVKQHFIVCLQRQYAEGRDKSLQKREAHSSARLLLTNRRDWKQVKGKGLMVGVRRRLTKECDKYNPSEHQGRMNEGCKSMLSKMQPL